MHLIIENPDNLDLDKFVGWLCKVIQEMATSGELEDRARATQWDENLASINPGWAEDELGNAIAPTVRYIVSEYFSHLVIGRQGQNYVITVDPSLKLRGTSLTIDSIATLINEGNLSFYPYSYFDQVYDVVASMLKKLFVEWMQEEGNNN